MTGRRAAVGWLGGMLAVALGGGAPRAGAAPDNRHGDFDADGRMDPTIYCEATGEWRTLLVSTDYEPVVAWWGGPGRTAIQADYDGDGRADLAAYDREAGHWSLLLSGSGYAPAHFQFGGRGWVVVTGDYDGDGRADPAIYSEEQGRWRCLLSTARYGCADLSYGGPGRTAVSGDYDGDGWSDPGLYDRATGLWEVRLSAQGYQPASFFVDALGDEPVAPIPFDYDGDGKTDPALFAYQCGATIRKRYVFGWYVLHSSRQYAAQQPFYHLGREDCRPSNAEPTPGDYDGDRMGDYAVVWPDSSMWRMWRSTRGWGRDHCVDDWHATGFRPVQR